MKYYVTVDGREYEVEIQDNGRVLLEGEPISVDLARVAGENLYSLLMNHTSYEIAVEEIRGGYQILLGGELYQATVVDERQRRLLRGRDKPAAPHGELNVTAPIPGLIVKLEVEEGEEVDVNQPLVILEAMKMENEIRSPRRGVVRAVLVEPGQSVEQGAVLVILSDTT